MARSPWARSTWAIAFLWLAALMAPGGGRVTATHVAAVAPAVSLEVSGSPLRADPRGRALTVRVTLSVRARVRVRVTDFEGDTVRVLMDGERRAGTHQRRWRGRDRSGRRVPIGAYRIEAVATPIGADAEAAPARAGTWVTVASRPIYPADPGVITVVVDPGHGGPFDGAVAPDGTREADLNLDIGLRLARMLEGAGVNAVLTRDTDRQVNWPPVDRTFDGVVDVTDDLAARADLANAARADLFIAVHNNFAVDRTTGGPSTYHSDERTFRDRAVRLARGIQSSMVDALDGFGGDGWRPYDHGVLSYPYYVLRDYDPPRLLRPTRMPGVLSEGLFLTHPRELRLLQQARVRQAMANAYYEAVLRPGERRRVRLRVTAPSEPGLWVLMVDALDRAGAPASRTGSPMLHVPLPVLARSDLTSVRRSAPPAPPVGRP
jgi:N-acetylmuramoyl-L-alanine amidase